MWDGEEDYMFLPFKEVVKPRKNRVYWYENCGHVVNVDAPHVFNSKVIRFFRIPQKILN